MRAGQEQPLRLTRKPPSVRRKRIMEIIHMKLRTIILTRTNWKQNRENVSEWVWDYYGAYGTKKKNPTGAKSGNYRVYRGGGWNDFAKHLRSAYRAAGRQDQAGFNVGIKGKK